MNKRPREESVEEERDIKRIVPDSRAIPVDLITPIIECSICYETMYNPHTLCCGHTFCDYCVHSWMAKKKSCPVCRARVLRRPVRNDAMKNIIELYEQALSDEDKKKRTNVKRQVDEDIKKEYDDLVRMAENAKERGITMLSILEEWNPQEKHNFKIAIDKYFGACRKYYLDLCGLNEKTIKEATEEQLVTIFSNINMQSCTLLTTSGLDCEAAKSVLLSMVLYA